MTHGLGKSSINKPVSLKRFAPQERLVHSRDARLAASCSLRRPVVGLLRCIWDATCSRSGMDGAVTCKAEASSVSNDWRMSQGYSVQTRCSHE